MVYTVNEDGALFNPETNRKVLPTQPTPTGMGQVTAEITNTADTCRVEAVCRSHIIPVIFVPGIMGSNLIGTVEKDGKQVDAFAWAPDGILGTAWHYVAADPEARQKALDPKTTRVNHTVKKAPEVFEASMSKEDARKLAEKRGWGTVYNKSYWPVLSALHTLLNAAPQDMIEPIEGHGVKHTGSKKEDKKAAETARGIWTELYEDGIKGYESIDSLHKVKGKAEILKPDDVKHAACYEYRIYAAGYNWLRSNYDSARGPDEWSLKNVVERVLAECQKEDKTCKKVILISHSMGGLVSRAYSKGNEDNILGIIHGVMPATGAPPMYKRMRAGFGGVEVKETKGFLDKLNMALFATVVGNNALETTAVLASCMGALELAPTMDYGKQKSNIKQWLRIKNADGSIVYLPKADPYSEIYATNKWYSLVPFVGSENTVDGHNSRINPSKMNLGGNDIQYFIKNILMAKQFHTDHMPYSYYHPNTYVSYLAKLKAFETVTWEVVGGRQSANPKDTGRRIRDLTQIEPITDADINAHSLENDNTKGGLDLRHNKQVKHVEVQGQGEGRGDGTVPEDSGMAPSSFVTAIFEQGDNKHDHQESWSVPAARRMALYSVVMLAKEDKRVK